MGDLIFNFGVILKLLLIFLVTMLVTLVIHEVGHYLAAKLLKIPVNKFVLGGGKKIFSFRFKETEFILSKLLIYGYVNFTCELNTFQGLVISFSGPFCNLIIGALSYYLAFESSQVYSSDSLSNTILILKFNFLNIVGIFQTDYSFAFKGLTFSTSILFALGFFNFLTFFSNLVPFSIWDGKSVLINLLKLTFRKKKELIDKYQDQIGLFVIGIYISIFFKNFFHL